jgi:phosphate uptake regulator
MMQTNTIEIIDTLEELFKSVMNLYWTYLSSLEEMVSKIPESDTEKLNEIHEHVRDVLDAMEYDVNLFTKAVDSDTEQIKNIQDQLKINDIYKFLKQK